jgi:hypothetical protein
MELSRGQVADRTVEERTGNNADGRSDITRLLRHLFAYMTGAEVRVCACSYLRARGCACVYDCVGPCRVCARARACVRVCCFQAVVQGMGACGRWRVAQAHFFKRPQRDLDKEASLRCAKQTHTHGAPTKHTAHESPLSRPLAALQQPRASLRRTVTLASTKSLNTRKKAFLGLAEPKPKALGAETSGVELSAGLPPAEASGLPHTDLGAPNGAAPSVDAAAAAAMADASGGICCSFARGVCLRLDCREGAHIDVQLSELSRIGCSQGDACAFHPRGWWQRDACAFHPRGWWF